MSHFASVRDGRVINVVVAEQEDIDKMPVEEGVKWIQCSYNTFGGVHYQPNSRIPSEDQSKALRGNYPGADYIYDEENDVFYPPVPDDKYEYEISGPTWMWKMTEKGETDYMKDNIFNFMKFFVDLNFPTMKTDYPSGVAEAWVQTIRDETNKIKEELDNGTRTKLSKDEYFAILGEITDSFE